MLAILVIITIGGGADPPFIVFSGGTICYDTVVQQKQSQAVRFEAYGRGAVTNGKY